MKMLLTSTGLTNAKVRDFFVSRFDTLDNKRACLVYTVRDEREWQWVEHYDAELKSIGLKYDGINISEEKDLSDLPEYDTYYVCGGNTFYILDRLRKTGLDKVILKAIESGKFYVGVSAGSIIAGPDIEIAGIAGGDENDISLQDLRGFEIVPFHISPHYADGYRNEIEEFYDKRKIPVIALNDDQAIFIDNDRIELVGEKEGGEIFGKINL